MCSSIFAVSEGVLRVVTEDVVQASLVSDKGAEATLVSWTTETFTAAYDGATSDIANVRIQYTLAGTAEEVSYVVKVTPSRAQKIEFYSIIFAKECNFYAEIIPALNAVLKGIGEKPLRFPKCVYSSLEPGKEMIMLENLQEQGYSMQDRTVGIDAAHSLLVLQELARLHAASLLLQAITPHQPLVHRFQALQKEWTKEFNLAGDFGTFVGNYLDIAVEMFEKMGGCEEVVAWVRKIKPEAWTLYKQQLVATPPFAVITHGDCWINNLLFRYDEDKRPVEVKMLDLQGCRVASLATDLLHFLNMNLTGPVRRPNLNTFLASYHATLASVMQKGGSVVPFTLEQLQQEYVDRGYYGVLYCLMWLPNMVRRPEDMMDILDRTEGGRNAERDNVLVMVDKNSLLKPRIISVVEEWMERGVIS
nr:uncharacterized protein LOC128699715 [Cherax quadricarinatus]